MRKIKVGKRAKSSGRNCADWFDGSNHLAKQSAQRSDSTGEPNKGSPEATSLSLAEGGRIPARTPAEEFLDSRTS